MKTILALDDSKEVLALRKSVFTAFGYRVHTFESAKNALLHFLQSPVDLMLTDYEMPEMTGVQFASSCRFLGFSGPIVMVSGAVDVEQSCSQHIDHVLRKAEPPAKLISLVQRYLGRNELDSEHTGTFGTKEIDGHESFNLDLHNSAAIRPRSTGPANMPQHWNRGLFERPSIKLSLVS